MALWCQQQTLGVDSSALQDRKQFVSVEFVQIFILLVWIHH